MNSGSGPQRAPPVWSMSTFARNLEQADVRPKAGVGKTGPDTWRGVFLRGLVVITVQPALPGVPGGVGPAGARAPDRAEETSGHLTLPEDRPQ
jgi:hypothetical protein